MTAIVEIENLYELGACFAAHALAVEWFGPLADWRGGVAALVFAGRLAGNVGGDRLSYALTLRACRRLGTDPDATSADRATAALFHLFRVFGRQGPLAARRWLQRPSVVAVFESGADDETRADLLCLQAHIAAAFRDTDAAEACWQAARTLAPERPWIWRERSALLVAADRYPEALDAARESLRLRPWYRPAVQQGAHVLTLLGRDDEAVELLEGAIDAQRGRQESAAVAGQLATVYAELQRPTEALGALDRFEAWSPLLEEPGRQWLASRRGEARLLLNDLPGAAELAETLAATSYFHAKTAERLRDPKHQAARRVTLPVPFVRQHEKTCAPATLAALSRFWNRPADQEDITREIWYGGTFDHQERWWAETHGWVAREFRADWASAVALFDAGIPFALVTTGVNSGHLQAGVGYDARRGTLVIRDPFERNQSEPLADEFFQRHAFSGPRAMALVPADDPEAVARLRAAPLPETALHDALYLLRRALHVHDRPAARAALDRLESLASGVGEMQSQGDSDPHQDPEGRVTLLARRELAVYDGDDAALLGAVEGLLALFPGEDRLRLEKLYALRRLARPVEARAWLETCVADPAQSEPNLWRELAVELAADARQRSRARQWLARALFYQPTEPTHLYALAETRWNERDFAEGTALFRLAACAATTREDYWQRFFGASRHLRETDEALRLLDARFQRLGDRSAQPARTLFWAHRERHAAGPAAAVLAEALRRRPDDGQTLLFAATAHARDGEHARAAEWLDAAKGKAAPGMFERAAAELCGLRGDAAGSLAHWREVLAREPLDAAAHQAVARMLAETDARGPVAAREFLDGAVARFPHAVALHELRVQWLVEDPGRGSAAHVAAVDALLAVQGINVWAHRERALAHLSRHDSAAALGVLDEAERLDPLAPPTHALRGRTLLVQGERAAAQASLRRALTLDVDLAGVHGALLDACATPVERRSALDFVHGEIVRQSGSTGDGILAFREAATPLLDRSELQTRLDRLLEARPDRWQAWSAVVSQHADAGRLDEAHARAVAATEQFPLLMRAWMDLAAIERMRGNDEAQIDALTRALLPRADHGEASRLLAAAHSRAGRFAEARRVLTEAIAAAPLDVANRGALAETLWAEDRQTQGVRAVEILADALRREPGFVRGWDLLERYATALGEPARLEATVRLLTTTRPGETRSWLRLAQTLPGETGTALVERLGALDRALALNPRCEDAHDLRAVLLACAGRFDEALAACDPPGELYPGGTRPFTLEGRAAWVLARRGDLTGARDRMRAVLADQPGYEWGWRLLAEWAEAAGDQKETLTAAERLAFLAPHAAGPLGYLAAARLKVGQRANAKRDLREAMRRDPGYLYAPLTLLRVQMEDREVAAAEVTLQFFERHFPGSLALSRTVLIAAHQKDKARACAAFSALVLTQPAPEEEDGGVKEAADAMFRAGWRGAAETALRSALRAAAGTGHPEAGALWVRSRVSRGRWFGLGTELHRLPVGGDTARRARVAYVGKLGSHQRRFRLRRTVRRWREILRADTESWGEAGYALVTSGLNREAAAWMEDWRARPDVTPKMLFNLTLALRRAGREREGLFVSRWAVTLPADHTNLFHAAWIALEDALDPNPAAYRRSVDLHAENILKAEGMKMAFRYVHVLTGHVLAVRGKSDLADRGAAWRTARNGLRTESQRKAILQGNPDFRRADNRAREQMARHAGDRWTPLAIRAFSPPAISLRQRLVLVYLLAIFGALCLVSGIYLIARSLGRS